MTFDEEVSMYYSLALFLRYVATGGRERCRWCGEWVPARARWRVALSGLSVLEPLPHDGPCGFPCGVDVRQTFHYGPAHRTHHGYGCEWCERIARETAQ